MDIDRGRFHVGFDCRFHRGFKVPVLFWLCAPINLAGVKVIGDYVNNYKQGLPSELGLVLLMDPANGAPKAIIDGSHLTDMRTGAVTAIGAKHLARRTSKILGHVGARGTAYWNVRLLDRLSKAAVELSALTRRHLLALPSASQGSHRTALSLRDPSAAPRAPRSLPQRLQLRLSPSRH